jgi:hypothetical protein
MCFSFSISYVALILSDIYLGIYHCWCCWSLCIAKLGFPTRPPSTTPPPHRWFSIVNYFWMLFYSGQGELSEVAVHLQGVSCAPSNGLWEDDVRLWIWPHVCFGGVDAMGHGIYFYLFLVLHIVHILCLIRFSLSSFHNAKILICKL